ncbi:Multidrug resistance-associated protein 1 [Schistosoma haematobium]|uniref:Multidrug resistance-associated protein 1 n=1 Tax=Schistosoma haematobium TaxID=6185 RepID=A0A922LSX5_SCHHA|nr:Multidrug resistance-associated protein 1 [Schistosoma haematobium]KAH9592808.1 Multidrug resistance-associated protein 1 [Schistosoma haematobium]
MVAGNQQEVHTPFIPSRYWSSCTPLVWNMGFPTPLSGLSIPTNPIKAPDIRFSSSQFRKQNPHFENAVSRTSLLVIVCIIEMTINNLTILALNTMIHCTCCTIF